MKRVKERQADGPPKASCQWRKDEEQRMLQQFDTKVDESVPNTGLVAVLNVMGYADEEIGADSRYGELWVSNRVAVIPFVDGTNYWAYEVPVTLGGTQDVVAAIRDVAGNMDYVTNRVSVSIVTNAAYAYDASGCLTNIQYRGAGYTNTLALDWDSQYRLACVETNGVLAERYAYDALGRMAWYSDGSGTNCLVYDGVHVIAEVDGDGVLLKSYAWGPGIDNLLAFTVYSGSGTNTFYCLTDHLGSVHALVDENGAISESYRYDAWGRVLGVYDGDGAPLEKSAVGNRCLWQGRWYSWDTGLYHFRARWYDPITGRWLSNDPIGISGGLNQYVFCADNPVYSRDPFGLCEGTETIWWQRQPWKYPSEVLRFLLHEDYPIQRAIHANDTTELLAFLGPLAAAPEAVMAGLAPFAHGGAEWHLGLEYGPKLNIIHIGRSVRHGVHVAVGWVAPKVADVHIYLKETFPFYDRIWRPPR